MVEIVADRCFGQQKLAEKVAAVAETAVVVVVAALVAVESVDSKTLVGDTFVVAEGSPAALRILAAAAAAEAGKENLAAAVAAD